MTFGNFVKKIRPPFLKWILPIGMDIATIASNVAGGLTNTTAAWLSFFGFSLMQVKDALDNSASRDETRGLRDQIITLKRELRERSDLPYTPQPTGCINLGLHTDNRSTAVSFLLALVNTMLASAATGINTWLNTQPESKEQEYCVSAYCITVYTLTTCSLLLSTVERYIKANNLENWKSQHAEVLARLLEMKNDIPLRGVSVEKREPAESDLQLQAEVFNPPFSAPAKRTIVSPPGASAAATAATVDPSVSINLDPYRQKSP